LLTPFEILELTEKGKMFRLLYVQGREAAMSDELKIVLEDVKEKFDTVIEAFDMVKEKLDRHEQAEEGRVQRIEERLDRHDGHLQGIEERLDRHDGHLQRIEDRLTVLQKDFNEHRENTELHVGKKKKKVS
jgi:predicted nuclease with TOPRIM domain